MKIKHINILRHLLAAVAIVNLVLNFSPAVLARDGRQPALRVGYLPGDIKLDGVLDEPEWAATDSIENLTMIEPDEGAPPTAGTIVKVLANSNEVVFGIDCKDPEPESIVSFSKSRDAHFRREDHILLVLDTFRDGRSGYVFSVNPGGARYDALVADRGERENSNWDDAWEAATSRNDSGWCVEVRLPIRSINYKAGLKTWGFNIQRRVQRLQETSRWASPQRDIEITQTFRAGLLTNLPDFKLGWGLSVRPSMVGGGGSSAPDEPFQSERDISLDVKQMLGSNLTASVTVNTDFAETEVDVRQTNLTRFPLFFPEKRTFFLEGADIFDFGIGLWRDVIPFFSRRIGLLEEQEVPLIIGGKINGRVGGSNIGALAVRTDDVSGLAPKTTLGVVRIQQNILNESSVGMLATFGDPQGLEGSWLAGMDFTYQTSSFQGDKNFLVGLWGLAVNRSDLAGDKTAVGFKVDYPNDLWDLSLTYKRIGDGFDPSLGFVPRTGVQIIHVGMQYNPRPQWRWLRQMFHQLRLRLVADLDSKWETYRAFTAPLNWLLESGDRFEFNIVPYGDRLTEPFEIADGIVIPTGSYHWTRFRLEGGLAAKRKFSGQLSWWFGRFYNGTLDQIELELSWKPAPLFTLEFSGERNQGRLPAGDFTQDLIETRLLLNFSPDLQVASLLQYDNESDSFGTNTRLRWTFNPLGDMFLIYNHNLRELDDRLIRDNYQLLVKLQYTFRR